MVNMRDNAEVSYIHRVMVPVLSEPEGQVEGQKLWISIQTENTEILTHYTAKTKLFRILKLRYHRKILFHTFFHKNLQLL